MQPPRVDNHGAAHKGSQLQTQIYVNRRTDELDSEIKLQMPRLDASAKFTWVSPLPSDGYAEYRDEAFLRALGLEQHWAALRKFWPRGGPVWDALAIIDTGVDRPTVLLAEGKSHPKELESSCSAGTNSRPMIEAALAQTRDWLGAKGDPTSWTEGHYQTANRLAHLEFLRRQGVHAWFAHLMFTDDHDHVAATRSELSAALERAYADLGLADAQLPYVGHVFLKARARTEIA